MTNPPKSLKVFVFDIETAPLLAYIWRPYDDYVTHERLVNDSFMLSWAGKWLEKKRIYSDVLNEQEAQTQHDARIVTSLAEMLREADIIVAHNVDRFDLPMLNNRLLSLGLEPLGPIQTIDTLKLAKRSFRLAYNKLDYLGEFLGLGKKIKTDFALWQAAYHGDPGALKRMQKYNKRDVTLLEDVFMALRPYVGGLPRMVEPTEKDQRACPTCGSDGLVRRGVYRTNAGTYQKYHCKSCLRYCSERKSIKETGLAVRPR